MPKWSGWSRGALAECAEHATLVINPIIYAEASIRHTTIEGLDAGLPATLYRREPRPWQLRLGSASRYAAAEEARGTRLCRISTLARTLP